MNPRTNPLPYLYSAGVHDRHRASVYLDKFHEEMRRRETNQAIDTIKGQTTRCTRLRERRLKKRKEKKLFATFSIRSPLALIAEKNAASTADEREELR